MEMKSQWKNKKYIWKNYNPPETTASIPMTRALKIKKPAVK